MRSYWHPPVRPFNAAADDARARAHGINAIDKLCARRRNGAHNFDLSRAGTAGREASAADVYDDMNMAL